MGGVGGDGFEGGGAGVEGGRCRGDAQALRQRLCWGGHEPRRLEDTHVAVWFGVLAFRVEAEVLGEGMQKCALVGRHGLEPEALLLGRVGEDAELALLLLCKAEFFAEELQSGV